jgi:hypothetical protein
MAITPDDSRRIYEEVKANHAKLNACDRHDFEPVPKYPDKPSHPLKDYVCRRCGGRIDAIAHNWYQRGLSSAFSQTGKTGGEAVR